jgi:hypothetical protein
MINGTHIRCCRTRKCLYVLAGDVFCEGSTWQTETCEQEWDTDCWSAFMLIYLLLLFVCVCRFEFFPILFSCCTFHPPPPTHTHTRKWAFKICVSTFSGLYSMYFTNVANLCLFLNPMKTRWDIVYVINNTVLHTTYSFIKVSFILI